MRNSSFDNLWKLHWKWGKGILVNEIRQTDTGTVYLSDILGPYYNFATPKTKKPEEFNHKEVERILKSKGHKPSVFLTEKQQDLGFTEHLIKNGYKFDARDTWVLLDKGLYKNKRGKAKITDVIPETFKDFNKVLSKVFSDFDGNEKYLEICLKILKGEAENIFSDFSSRLYVIYDDKEPAAGAGLFYSKQGNFAYLHNAGTLKKYRKRGYQTALIKHRVNVALENGIDNIYSIVEQGGQSWSNCIKNGFNQAQVMYVLVK